VIKLESLEARKSTAVAISWGRPKRPIGMAAFIVSFQPEALAS
jgi:hypothetical protein